MALASGAGRLQHAEHIGDPGQAGTQLRCDPTAARTACGHHPGSSQGLVHCRRQSRWLRLQQPSQLSLLRAHLALQREEVLGTVRRGARRGLPVGAVRHGQLPRKLAKVMKQLASLLARLGQFGVLTHQLLSHSSHLFPALGCTVESLPKLPVTSFQAHTQPRELPVLASELRAQGLLSSEHLGQLCLGALQPLLLIFQHSLDALHVLLLAPATTGRGERGQDDAASDAAAIAARAAIVPAAPAAINGGQLVPAWKGLHGRQRPYAECAIGRVGNPTALLQDLPDPRH